MPASLMGGLGQDNHATAKRRRNREMTTAPARSKEVERAELHKTIWRIANELRGQVDGWDFKAYVLGMLFYRFLSESLVEHINSAERVSDPHFDYRTLSREDAELGRSVTTHEKGFYILPEDLFCNVQAKASSDTNLNVTMKRALDNIATSALGSPSESDFKGLFDDIDVNSSRLGTTVAEKNKRLTRLLNAIGGLDLGHRDNTIDAFGDAYEYLMTMYASGAGKSGGEFYTPQEVSELLAKITVVGKTEVNKVYDPTCGSGSLLLKFAKVLGPDRVRQGYYGQEVNPTTYNLARINMFLHGIPYEKFDIAYGDTLTDPAHWDEEPFEAIVSNPPYSIPWEGSDNATLIDDPRFSPAGVLAPKARADLAFTMHMLSWLAEDGTAAIVEFPGVLYRSGAEQKIRKYLIDNNFVDAVIQLPPDLFFGTTIATCIIVLKKSKRDNKVLFVDATAVSVREGNKNMLSDANQKTILNAFTDRADIEHFAALIDNKALAENDYNLSVTSYVEAKDTRVIVDVAELNNRITEIVQRQSELRTEIDMLVADLETDAYGDSLGELVRSTIPRDEWLPLGAVGTFQRGRRFTKADFVSEGLPAIHYGDIYTSYGVATTSTVTHVRPDIEGRLRFADPGDLIIAGVGETVEDVGKAVAWLGVGPVAVHDDAFTFKHEMDPRYAAYLFQTKAFHAQKNKHVARAKVKPVVGRGYRQDPSPRSPTR